MAELSLKDELLAIMAMHQQVLKTHAIAIASLTNDPVTGLQAMRAMTIDRVNDAIAANIGTENEAIWRRALQLAEAFTAEMQPPASPKGDGGSG